ncbi:MAG: tRNA guanosine(15) transglycosylase TgtA [archaeon]|nr:tRNA guanosine(15) transglycosylase TgtA [archaeon]MCP8305720.1 tRNA guanosine(15) transglycosylase TgtA [archaeon]
MFEIRTTDLAGRIGKIRTKSGLLETPCILPVIHPVRQSLAPKEMARIGFKAVMTNAYITLKTFGKVAEEKGIHKIIDYDGIIMTDSGGYQMLKYGDVEVTPLEMASFQEKIGSDMAIVLDTPTGTDVDRRRASETVEITLRAAEETLKAVKAEGTLWTGPIQGGSHLDLLKMSAERTGKMAFDIFALGSPTEVMESYNFNLLVQMIITVKQVLPIDKPLHLFGAGHPLTIPLVIALGCDLFDSASYMLYAREGRYMTEYGTARLDELTYLPCNCSICSTHTLKEIKEAGVEERTQKIAIHNLNVLLKEVRATKQAIEDGRIWEYLGTKARAHPKLWEAFKSLSNHYEFLEDGTPLFKPRAIFFYEPHDLMRPEVLRYHKRLIEDVSVKKKTLLLLPESDVKPFYKSPSYIKLIEALGDGLEKVQVCFLSPPFGVVPVELSDVYPLSQYLSSIEPDYDVMKEVLKRSKEFIRKNSFRKILLLNHLDAYSPLFKMMASSLENCYIIDALGDTNRSLDRAFNKISHIIDIEARC